MRTLDLALLQAGAGIKGEFENRLKGLIEEVKSSPTPIILFIDEAHTMIGAGGQAGQNDAANLLKPALARGELRTIAATTWSEYKKYFEKDPALARRFQVVKVEEPTEAKCAGDAARRGARAGEAPQRAHPGRRPGWPAVKLSHRYLPDRQLPDKAVSVLDTACARLALGQNATPPAIEDATRADRRSAPCRRASWSAKPLSGADHAERLAAIAQAEGRDRSAPDGIDRRAGRRSATWSARSARSARKLETGASRAAAAAAPAAAADGTAAAPAVQPAARLRKPCARNWPR